MKTFIKIILILVVIGVIGDSCGGETTESNSEVTTSYKRNSGDTSYNSTSERAAKAIVAHINNKDACQIIVKTSDGEVTTFKRNSNNSMSVKFEQGVQSQGFYQIAGTLKGYANDVKISDKVFLGQAEPAFNIFNKEVLSRVLDITISMSELPEDKIQESTDGEFYMIQLPIDNTNALVGVSKDGTTYYQSDGETETWVVFDDNITVQFP